MAFEACKPNANDGAERRGSISWKHLTINVMICPTVAATHGATFTVLPERVPHIYGDFVVTKNRGELCEPSLLSD